MNIILYTHIICPPNKILHNRPARENYSYNIHVINIIISHIYYMGEWNSECSARRACLSGMKVGFTYKQEYVGIYSITNIIYEMTSTILCSSSLSSSKHK